MFRQVETIGFSPNEHVPETCPVFVIFIHEQRNPRLLFMFFSRASRLRSHPFRLAIDGGIENRSVICKADRNRMRPSTGVQRGQPWTRAVSSFVRIPAEISGSLSAMARGKSNPF